MSELLTLTTYTLMYLFFSILKNIFIMLAVGFDCKSKGLKNKAGWMALTFFIPISAIIYLCVRNSSAKKEVPLYCNTCGFTAQPNSKMCPRCGNYSLQEYQIVNSKENRKSAILCLVLAIIFAAVSVFTYLAMAKQALQPLEDKGSSGYEDFFNYDGDDNNDFFNFDNDDSNSNSNEDDFNNFGK